MKKRANISNIFTNHLKATNIEYFVQEVERDYEDERKSEIQFIKEAKDKVSYLILGEK
jgi:hypothetical protein